MLGLYGKHPAKGDFLESGLPVQPALEAWLDGALAEARNGLGDAWETVWATARPLRFWLGPSLWGEPVAGVLATSADKVGRRFPLLIIGLGADCPPAPVIDAAQGWHDAVAAHLAGLLAAEDIAANTALAGLAPPTPTALPAGPPEFWAVRPGADISGLWEDVAVTDHHRASHNRSYWWQTGGSHAQVWAGEGLPSGHVLAWFLRGYAENG